MSGQKKRILVADDDPGILEAIQLMLEDAGYDVVTTVNGETVYKVKEKFPDLILLDIWMSGQDGEEICRYLKNKSETKHIPIIMISANKDTEEIANKAGADGFVTKPFEMNDLLIKVEKYLK